MKKILCGLILTLATVSLAASNDCRIVGCDANELQSILKTCPTPPACPSVTITPTIEHCTKCVTKPNGKTICHKCQIIWQ